MIWHEFKALGTEIVITANLNDEQKKLLIEAEKEILDFEKRFSRFIVGNELNGFNTSVEESFEASEALVGILTEAKKYYLKTGGIFDPTIISSLEAIGYKKSFDIISSNLNNSLSADVDLQKINNNFLSRTRLDDLTIVENKIYRPKNLKIDLGGIGKGYIIDQLSKNLFSNIENYWLSAGGDIFVSGHEDDNRDFHIEVQDPNNPEQNIFSINTHGQKLGIATSGIIKRTGKTNDFTWHHLIDPRNGLPVENNILSVTVISSSATRADIFAKTVLILGSAAGLEFIEEENDSAAIIFRKNEEPLFSSRVNLYLKNYEKNIKI